MAAVDFAVRKPTGEVVLLAEAKNKLKTTSKWAQEVHRNLRSHAGCDAPFFVLATPDRFYFWLDDRLPEPTAPAIEMDAREILLPYIRRAGLDDERMSGPGFELLVSSWLRGLLSSESDDVRSRYPAALRDAGFFDAVRGALLNYHPE